MRIAVISFPGSHGARDVVHAFSKILGHETYLVGEKEENLRKPELVVIPGGFSYGDYLRAGGLAKASRVTGPLKKFGTEGGRIVGFGNGFQILCELSLLPGALLQNASMRFETGAVRLLFQSANVPMLKSLDDKILKLPIGCYSGRYVADDRTLRELEENGLCVASYCDEQGETDRENDPTGSMQSIAAVVNRNKNIFGIMAHPERAVEERVFGTDGLELLSALTV